MDIYNAILAAADYIERHPNDFCFYSREVPSNCGSPGCALGWIGVFAGAKAGTDVRDIAPAVLGVSEGEFYKRLTGLHNEHGFISGRWWTKYADACAVVMRMYAERYHKPESKQELDPVLAKMLQNMDNILTEDLTT